MTDDSLSPQMPAVRDSAFLTDEERKDTHIVDVLIEERCPSFRAHWSWPVVRPTLYGLLGYRRARRMADTIMQMTGRESFDYLAETLDFNISVDAAERMPTTGRVIVAANHPTGLADGVAVWDMLSKIRRDIIFFANADAVRVNPNFQDAIIPVEWVMDKRSPAKTRETLKRAYEAFEAEKCVVIFPSGRLAAQVDGVLREKEWFSTVISLARKTKATIVPLNLDARNSKLYYFLSRLNGELRDITLFHELLNKRGSRFRMTFGPAIAPETLVGDTVALTDQLKSYVAYTLKDDRDAIFTPTPIKTPV